MIHFDADHNIHCLVAGRKDFMMIDPKFSEYLNVTQVRWNKELTRHRCFRCFLQGNESFDEVVAERYENLVVSKALAGRKRRST